MVGSTACCLVVNLLNGLDLLLGCKSSEWFGSTVLPGCGFTAWSIFTYSQVVDQLGCSATAWLYIYCLVCICTVWLWPYILPGCESVAWKDCPPTRENLNCTSTWKGLEPSIGEFCRSSGIMEETVVDSILQFASIYICSFPTQTKGVRKGRMATDF